MGNININFCCNGRDEHIPVQASQNKGKHQEDTEADETIRNTEFYRKTIQSVIIAKPELSFGQQMIQDLFDLTDEAKVPLQGENGWKCLNNTNQFELYGFEWRKEDKQIVNIFRSQFYLKSSLKRYVDLDLEEMKNINKKIEDIKIIDENEDHDESIRYICYKGVTMLSSRDFIYLKKRQFLNEKIFVEAVKSIEDDRVFVEKKKTRGQINLAGQIVEQIDSETLVIKQFIDVDFRMNMALNTLQKSVVKEFQKYYEALQLYLVNI